MIIAVEKDCISFDDEKVYPPFEMDELKRVLGEGRRVVVNEEKNIVNRVWDEHGFFCWENADGTVDSFAVCMREYQKSPVNGVFGGSLLIGKKEYTDVKWKRDRYDMCDIVKNGCFELETLLDSSGESDKEFGKMMSSRIGISYHAPKIKKPKKYIMPKCDEPVLFFKNFNFKLAVINELMYKKELMQPIFDIYEFAEEKNIDVEEKGYEPIKQAVKWFKDLPVPASLANEVTEIIMDGGNKIYHQIEPYWDGEDDYFDIKALDEEEVRQFVNLKRITLMLAKPDKVKSMLEGMGIEVEIL